ncbi:hypothetical protein HDV00_006294 [Rhizophlyctis rosea]|nr:hypothetical protein HDV00_006294 [Rhizophlyctis rosea]
MCAYAVIVGDTLPLVLSQLVPTTSFIHPFVSSRNAMITLTTVCVSLPLSLHRDISALAKSSAVSVVAIVFIIFAVIVGGLGVSDDVKGSGDKWTFVHSGVFQFAETNHGSIRGRYTSIHWVKPNQTSPPKPPSASLLFCLTLATSGYLTFTSKTQGNILNNFPADNRLINAARIMFAINMFLTFPLECFVCREVLWGYFFGGDDNGGGGGGHGGGGGYELGTKTHVGVTLGLVFSAMGVALLTCDLGFVLEITVSFGACPAHTFFAREGRPPDILNQSHPSVIKLQGGFAAPMLAYIFPAACYIKLASGNWWEGKKIGKVICVVFGVITMLLSTILTLVGRGEGGEAKKC